MTSQSSQRAESRHLLETFFDTPPDDPQRQSLRNELAAQFLPLVHYLARKMSHRGELLDDVVQVGSIGLLNAIDRFDPTRGVEFTTFAVPTIAGEIRRFFRDTSWTLHVPRRAQELQTAIREAEAALAQELRRSPTLNEVAANLDVAPDLVLEAKNVASARSLASTDGTACADGTVEPMQIASIEDGFARAEAREMLRPALARLAGRERQIMILRYFDERTQAEIARIVGVSQMQVSRLITQSLKNMRECLGADDSLELEAMTA